jgi:hypothetical protein
MLGIGCTRLNEAACGAPGCVVPIEDGGGVFAVDLAKPIASDPSGADLALPPGADLALPPGADLALPPGVDLSKPDLGAGSNVASTGAICGGSVSCVPGDDCILIHNSDSSKMEGACLQRCAQDSDCTQHQPGGLSPRCIQVDGAGAQTYCSIACNPIDAAVGTNGCPPNLACTFTTQSGQYSYCSFMGSGGNGADCLTNGNEDCAPGFTCVFFDTFHATCAQACHVGTSGECGVGTCHAPDGLATAAWGACLQ